MGLAPDQFWRMSLTEWRATVEGFAMRKGARRSAPLSRNEFDELVKTHPDQNPLAPFGGEGQG